jgi:hypothetical protein
MKDSKKLEIVANLHETWDPNIRPAPAERDWMTNSTDGFAYRCLPLNIANAHGWEILTPAGFEAYWDGDPGPSGVKIKPDPDMPSEQAPVALFGQATFTFHIQAIFRTPPSWNLWVSGSPNRFKEGVQPLTGVIETDWSPYSFTMNWRFTRRNHWVRFEKAEPICFFFPVQRNVLDKFDPIIRPMKNDPKLACDFAQWSQSRNAFHEQIKKHPPKRPTDAWQKLYFRGLTPDGKGGPASHQSKLRLKEFKRSR